MTVTGTCISVFQPEGVLTKVQVNKIALNPTLHGKCAVFSVFFLSASGKKVIFHTIVANSITNYGGQNVVALECRTKALYLF